MERALSIVDKFKKDGIIFVPMPVLDDEDMMDLLGKVQARLKKLEDKRQS